MRGISFLAKIVVVFIAAFSTNVSTAQAHHKIPCHTHYCQVRAANEHCSNRHVKDCIFYAASIYHQDLEAAYRVANCESGFDPHNSNGTDFGLYQFLPSTFATTSYARHSYWEARWSALAAMEMWSWGQKNQWQCR